MNKNKNQAFTLVELIVVITILAILATIAFISLNGYASNSRDSKRLSDLGSMKKVLELYYLKNNHYPEPDNVVNITYSGSLAWYMGEFGEEVRRKVERINPSPRDPLTDTYYAYGLTNNRQEYEMGTILENADNGAVNIISQANANSEGYTAYISGNYNKKIISIRSGNTIKILGVPTLITTDPSITELQTITEQKRRSLFSINNKTNLPGNIIEKINTGILGEGFVVTAEEIYENGAIQNTDVNGGETSLLLYEGTIEDLSNETIKTKVGENIISYYTGVESTLGNLYQDIASSDGEVVLDALISNRQGGLNSKDVSLSSNTNEEGGSSSGGGSIPLVNCNDGETVVDGQCSDPYWNNVVLMSYFDGLDGSRTVLDEKTNTYNLFGDSKILSNSPKFGNGSLYLDGSGDYVQIGNNGDLSFGTGDFTIDFWIKSNPGQDQFILGFRAPSSTGLHVTFGGYGGTQIGALRLAGLSGGDIAGTKRIDDGEWHLCSIVRDGNIIRAYIDGQLEVTGTDSSNYIFSNNRPVIGVHDFFLNTSFAQFYLDNLRITKGVARYSENFTLPLYNFPNK
ncbi:MAG: prepilin-type N-terminal cleavage/methylation domain-containing protein [Candidatus Gracilibacteria bacterium]|nr:prepilin-type N-terminal cleavage/methylation domain-containing protein [Candidatus Gracilibacteria bacterium]